MVRCSTTTTKAKEHIQNPPSLAAKVQLVLDDHACNDTTQLPQRSRQRFKKHWFHTGTCLQPRFLSLGTLCPTTRTRNPRPTHKSLHSGHSEAVLIAALSMSPPLLGPEHTARLLSEAAQCKHIPVSRGKSGFMMQGGV